MGPRPGGRDAPFSIPPRVRHLEPEQLSALTESFRAWYLASSRPAARRARGRIWLTYLVIRFTGAKLGEVAAIDHRTDLDLERRILTLGAGKRGMLKREVPLPPEVVGEIRTYLRDLANGSGRGRVFGLDQGFVRRKFYERADACSIPRDLASPQVLRASRALELLRNGMPLPVVQRILGQRTADLTAGYVEYGPGDVRQILEAYLLAALRSQTSARNLFAGRVGRIRRGKLLSEVTLQTPDRHRVVSVITNTSLESLGLERGSPATGLIKAPSVMVATGADPPRTSARNVLAGRIEAVRDDGVMAEILLVLSGGTEVCALITAHSARNMRLAEHDAAWAVFDATAVILSIPSRGEAREEVVA